MNKETTNAKDVDKSKVQVTYVEQMLIEADKAQKMCEDQNSMWDDLHIASTTKTTQSIKKEEVSSIYSEWHGVLREDQKITQSKPEIQDVQLTGDDTTPVPGN